MAGRIFFFFIGLLVLCNYCYADIEELFGIKTEKDENEGKKFCDYPECICYYIHDNCPVKWSNECSEDYYCTLTTNKPCCAEATCSNPDIDMVYVIDGSSSIGDENFNKMKDFIQELNKRFVIGTNDVRVGIQEYSDSSSFIYPVQLGEADKNGNINLLNDVVANMRYLTGTTYTGKALKRARTVMLTDAKGDRKNIPDILILYTDGNAFDGDEQVKEAAKLKKNGVKIICVGIGYSINMDKLEETASPSCKGTGDKLVFQAGFDELDTITDAIVQEACNCA